MTRWIETHPRTAALAIALLIVFVGCKLPPIPVPEPPTPTPTPIPTPAPPKPDPSPLCGPELSRSCWHMTPPSTVWQWRGRDGVTDYADAKDEPVPPVVKPPEGCNPREADLEASPLQRPTKLAVTMDAVRAELGDQRGNLAFAETRRRIAELLWKRGVCAFPGQEAVFAQAPDGLWEEWHAVAETDGGWPTHAYKGVHRTRSAAPVSLDPLPDRRAIWIRAHWVNGWLDATPEIRPQNGVEPAETNRLCTAYGYGKWADGRDRHNCALGLDLTPARLAREEWAMGGGSLCQAQPDGVDAFHRPDNWLQCGCGAGCTAARVCSADGKLCSGWAQR